MRQTTIIIELEGQKITRDTVLNYLRKGCIGCCIISENKKDTTFILADVFEHKLKEYKKWQK